MNHSNVAWQNMYMINMTQECLNNDPQQLFCFPSSPEDEDYITSSYSMSGDRSSCEEQTLFHGFLPSPSEPSRQEHRKKQNAIRHLRRKEQNRVAQRAFRKRKEDQIQTLQSKVDQLESLVSNLKGETKYWYNKSQELSKTKTSLYQAEDSHTLPDTFDATDRRLELSMGLLQHNLGMPLNMAPCSPEEHDIQDYGLKVSSAAR